MNRSCLFLFCFICSINVLFCQESPFNIEVIDLNKNPSPTGFSIGVLPTENGAYLNHFVTNDFNTSSEISYFDGDEVSVIFKSVGILNLLEGSEDGVFFVDEYFGNSVLVFVNRSTGVADTLTDRIDSFVSATLVNGKLITFSENFGVSSYTEEGVQEQLQATYPLCCGNNDIRPYRDGIIYHTRDEYIFTDGTAANTYSLFLSDGEAAIRDSLLITVEDSRDVQVYNFNTNELNRIRDTVFTLLDSITDVDTTIYLYDTTLFSSPNYLGNTPAGVLFSARVPQEGNKLFISDGSLKGTALVGTIAPGSVFGSESHNFSLDGKLFFNPDDDQLRNQIWISNGTSEGTFSLLSIEDDVPHDLFVDGWELNEQYLMLEVRISGGDAMFYSIDRLADVPEAVFVSSSSEEESTEVAYTMDGRLLKHQRNSSPARLYSYGIEPGDAFLIGAFTGVEEVVTIDDQYLFIWDAPYLLATNGRQPGFDTIIQSTTWANPDFPSREIFKLNGSTYAHVNHSEYGESIFQIYPGGQEPILVADLYDRNEGSNFYRLLAIDNYLLARGGSSYLLPPGFSSSSQVNRPIPVESFWVNGNHEPIGTTDEYIFMAEDDNFATSVKVDVTTGESSDVKAPFGFSNEIDFGNLNLLGGYGYIMGFERTFNPSITKTRLYQLDFSTETATVIHTDSFPSFDASSRNIKILTSADLVYFPKFSNDSIGPATFDPETGDIVLLDLTDKTNNVDFTFTGRQMLVRYHQSFQSGNLFFLSEEGRGSKLDSTINTDFLLDVGDQLFARNNEENLLVFDRLTGEVAELLPTNFIASDDNQNLTLLDDGRVAFLQQNVPGEWGLWITDGTTQGTAPFAGLPLPDSAPLQLVALRDFLAVRSNGSNLHLLDLESRAYFDVNLQLNGFRDEGIMSVISDKLYFLARNPFYGSEIHELRLIKSNSITGTVFLDENGDGVQNDGEPGINGYPVHVNGGEVNRTYTIADGRFAVVVEEGQDYELSIDGEDCFIPQQGVMNFSFIYSSGTEYNFNFPLQPDLGSPSLRPLLNTSTIRCGFEHDFWLTVLNDGCQPLAGEGSVTFPEEMAFLESDEPPLSNEDNTLVFAFDTLQPNASRRFRLRFRMPDENFAGQSINLGAVAGAMDGQGAMITSDTFAFSEILRCAIDPNDKQVAPSREEPSNSNYTQLDETLRYTIRFQNTGNDTAFTVRIQDQISESLNLETLKPLAASHPYSVSVREDRTVVFLFEDIFLPDSTTNLPGSQGFVTFEIEAFSDLEDFSTIDNTAGIYFDFNQPVITNTVTSTLVEFLDEDQDGFLFYDDCNDKNVDINPAAEEIPGNGIDENCDDSDFPVSTYTALAGELQAFPNPTRGELRLSYSDGILLNGTVFSATGAKLQTFRFRRNHQLNLKALPAGLYLLQLNEPTTGEWAIIKVIKE